MLHKEGLSFFNRLNIYHIMCSAVICFSNNMFNSEVKDCAMQIENEYKNAERAFHEKGPPYVQWAAAMAVGLQTGVPWVMCKQDDAPDPVVTISTSLFGQ